MAIITVYPQNFILTGMNEGPTEMNYSIMGLIEKNHFAEGDLVKIEYFKSRDEETGELQDLAVQEDVTYFRDEIGAKIERAETTISWFFEDGQVGETKKMVKYFDDLEGVEAQEKSRQRRVYSAKAYALNNLGVENAADLLSEAEAEAKIRLYIQGASSPLIDFLTNSQKDYLTDDVRNGMIAIL